MNNQDSNSGAAAGYLVIAVLIVLAIGAVWVAGGGMR